jgi:single-stranded-DNA-specific exonuclease
LSKAVAWSQASVPEAAQALEAAGFPGWKATLLARRGVLSKEAATEFLEPRLDQLHDPKRLLGMDRAVASLKKARDEKSAVALVGDYDVDGVSGTALLVAVLRHCGLQVHPILPHRMRDGYGFQVVHVERALALDCRLILTVDCGTNSHEAVTAALAAGLDVVVTDHHLPEGGLPPEVVLINPCQPACEYPFADLSGAGLAFKLALALAMACARPVDPQRLLPIASLGTVADMVPLLGENRTIAALGLAGLAHTRSEGLQALIQVAGLKRPYTAEDIGFRLGPRLNAPGRLDSAEASLELLLCRDPIQGRRLAAQLDGWNQERQGVERNATEEAREAFLKLDPLPSILVGWSENWHRGVVGIAAGRLAREFHRPVILLGVEGETATGSGRSIKGVHLHDFLAVDRDDLDRFGGHAQAVGLTVKSARLEELRNSWQERAEIFTGQLSLRTFEYELEFEPRHLDPHLLQGFDELQPFGQGNPAPLLRIRGPLRLLRPIRSFGRGHLSATAGCPDGCRIRFVGWGWQDRASEFESEFEILGYLEHDRYTGGSVLRLVDCRPWLAPEKVNSESPGDAASLEASGESRPMQSNLDTKGTS